MSKPVSLESVLRLYFDYEGSYNEAHQEVIDRYHDSTKRREAFKVDNKEYGIQARMGYVLRMKTKTSFWMYVADLEIRKRGTRKANEPLHSMPDCEYMYYGMYLNCFAYLSGAKKARLLLIQSCTATMIEYKWKPKMAKELLTHYAERDVIKEQVNLDL